MELQQRKLRYTEEQNQNLEAYKVQLSDRKLDDEVPREDFFLRPPKGISGTGDDKLVGQDIVHFPATGNAPIQDMWIAAVKRDTDVKFQKDVLELLKINPRTKKPKSAGGVGLPQVAYDWIHDDQGSKGTFDAYFFKKAPHLVAIVFRTEGSKDPGNPPPQIDYALATMRVGAEARAQKAGKATPPGKTTKGGGK